LVSNPLGGEEEGEVTDGRRRTGTERRKGKTGDGTGVRP